MSKTELKRLNVQRGRPMMEGVEDVLRVRREERPWLFVFAGTYKQAKQIMAEKEINPFEWIYLRSTDQLKGIRKKFYIRCGAWAERNDIKEIEDTLLMREMIQMPDIPI